MPAQRNSPPEAGILEPDTVQQTATTEETHLAQPGKDHSELPRLQSSVSFRPKSHQEQSGTASKDALGQQQHDEKQQQVQQMGVSQQTTSSKGDSGQSALTSSETKSSPVTLATLINAEEEDVMPLQRMKG